jgi:hypothetical protein
MSEGEDRKNCIKEKKMAEVQGYRSLVFTAYPSQLSDYYRITAAS